MHSLFLGHPIKSIPPTLSFTFDSSVCPCVVSPLLSSSRGFPLAAAEACIVPRPVGPSKVPHLMQELPGTCWRSLYVYQDISRLKSGRRSLSTTMLHKYACCINHVSCMRDPPRSREKTPHWPLHQSPSNSTLEK